MVSDTRYSEDIRSTLEEIGDSLLEQAKDRIVPLFKWTAYRILLGQSTTAAEPLFERHLEGFMWSLNPNRDIGKWTTLTGLAVLLDRTPENVARTLTSRLPSYGSLPEADYQISQSMLALSMLTGDQALVERWSKACYRVRPDSASPYTFELLALAELSWPDPKADLDVSSDVTARMVAGDQLYTSAPQVCGLQALAAVREMKAASLLHHRIQRLDDLVFGSGSKAKVTLSPPGPTYVHDPGGEAALEITVNAKGQGQLLVGPYDIPPFAHQLYAVIASAIERVDRSRLSHRAAQQALRDRALLRRDGICRGVLDVAPGVEIPGEHARLIEKRFMLGFEIAKHHIEGLSARPELRIRHKP